MSLQQEFEEAATKVKTLTKKPTDDELLQLYAFYKQATEGDNNTSKPSIVDLKAKYKWEKWTEKKGLSKEDAQKAYINLVKELITKYA